jgi:hypothetical protein
MIDTVIVSDSVVTVSKNDLVTLPSSPYPASTRASRSARGTLSINLELLISKLMLASKLYACLSLDRDLKAVTEDVTTDTTSASVRVSTFDRAIITLTFWSGVND